MINIRGKQTTVSFVDGKWGAVIRYKGDVIKTINNGTLYIMTPIMVGSKGLIGRFGGENISSFKDMYSVESAITFDGKDFKMNNKEVKTGKVLLLAVDLDKNYAFAVVHN